MDTTCLANGQRQTATLNYEISNMCEKKSRKTPQKISKLLAGSGLVTMPKPCKLCNDSFGNFGTRIVADKFSVALFSASRSTSETSWYVSEKT
jgi:hypothetical protein